MCESEKPFTFKNWEYSNYYWVEGFLLNFQYIPEKYKYNVIVIFPGISFSQARRKKWKIEQMFFNFFLFQRRIIHSN